MAKKVKSTVKINIEAGKATPAPPIGPSLAPHGINLMMFCKEYNARTAQQVGNIIPATITVFTDNSFTFSLGTPPTAQLIRKAAGVDKDVRRERLSVAEGVNAMKQVEGSARSMGIDVIE